MSNTFFQGGKIFSRGDLPPWLWAWSWYQQIMQVKWGTNFSPFYCEQWGKARGRFKPKFICCSPLWYLRPAGFS